MADEAAQALGAPTIAGTFVNPKGMARKMTAEERAGTTGHQEKEDLSCADT